MKINRSLMASVKFLCPLPKLEIFESWDIFDTLARITVVGHVKNNCGCCVLFLEGEQISFRP